MKSRGRMIVLAFACLTVGTVLPTTAGAGSSSRALRLARRDPGARVDGNTIVATGRGQRVVGVPDRPNVIVALGPHETIYGDGPAADQLGAIADHVTIRAGSGNDLLYGGRGARLIGGSGHDLLIDTGADATVVISSRQNVVVLSGKHDRVICSPGSRGDVIYVRASDSVSRGCRVSGARVRPFAAFAVAQHARHVDAATVTGRGTNDDPYVAPCSPPVGVDCTVTGFPARELNGFWANEYVPAYRCPADHPYLLNESYAPPGTTLPVGVGVRGLGPIGMSITGASTINPDSVFSLMTGTRTGFPYSSATNWTFGKNSYQLELHCTSDKRRGRPLQYPGPGPK